MTTRIGNDINTALHFLQQGDVVAIPTETVYGLAADALDPDAVLRIFEVKQRPFFDPLIIHVHTKDVVNRYVTHIPKKAALLMERHCPGPITFLLPKKEIIPDIVTSGLDTVAIRIPDHPMTLRLLQAFDGPLAAPSANPFGYISPTTAQHVYDQLQGKLPYILDGGPTGIGVESTIVGFEEDAVIVYRTGGLAVEAIEAIVGKVTIETNESSDPKSPGMLKSHYAPKKELLFDVDDLPLGKRIGAIAFDAYVSGIPASDQILLSPRGDLHEAARHLFAAMRQMDDSDVDLIVAVRFPDRGLGLAINDRLKRAAAK